MGNISATNPLKSVHVCQSYIKLNLWHFFWDKVGDFIFVLKLCFKLGFRPKSKLDPKIQF